MNHHKNDQDFLNKVRSGLDAGLEQLEPAIRERLRKSRRHAIDQADRKPFSLLGMPRLVPVGGYAALAVITLAVSLWFTMRPQPFPHKAAEEIEVLTMQGNLEMYKDLEFFQWLAQTNESR